MEINLLGQSNIKLNIILRRKNISIHNIKDLKQFYETDLLKNEVNQIQEQYIFI